jgi:hypothetical protein
MSRLRLSLDGEASPLCGRDLQADPCKRGLYIFKGTSTNQDFCFPARKASFDKGEYVQHIRPVGERSLTPPRGKKTVYRGSLNIKPPYSNASMT